MVSLTIRKRRKTDGSFRYTAYIRVKEQGSVVYSEAGAFSKKVLGVGQRKMMMSEIETHSPDKVNADLYPEY